MRHQLARKQQPLEGFTNHRRRRENPAVEHAGAHHQLPGQQDQKRAGDCQHPLQAPAPQLSLANVGKRRDFGQGFFVHGFLLPEGMNTKQLFMRG